MVTKTDTFFVNLFRVGSFNFFKAKRLSTHLFISLLITSLFASPTFSNEDSAQINLRDVDMSTLIETVSKITNKSFVVDPRVKGNVTLITNKDISKGELYDTFLSILEVHGYSAVPSGNIIKVVPANQAKQQPVPVVGADGQSIRNNPVSIKSAIESDYARFLTGSTPASTRNSNADRKADEVITRVVRIEHVPASMLVPILRPLVPNTGLLQAYTPSNTIVISDRVANINRIMQVIKSMDRADDEEIEVVKLRHASAKVLAQTIQTVRQTNVKGLRAKNNISADERTNSLLISGDKSSRLQIRRIISRLDTPQRTDEKTKVIYLKYAKATEMATVLGGISKTQKTTKATGKGAAGTVAAEVDIQADEASNSLIITADPEIQANLEKVIQRLDVRRAQVLVEAIIAEVSTNLSKDIGVALAANTNQGLVGATGTTTSTASLISILTGAIVPSVNGGALGLVDNRSNNRFGLLVNALKGDSATNILSTPSIVAMDNEEAEIVVGQNVPFITGSFTSTGDNTNATNPFQTIEREDVGLTLKIKPQINAGNTINLEISQEVSSIEESGVSASDLITNKRSINTNVMVENDQVLVLGGLLQDDFRDTVNKVPVLGNLPVVGGLFRTKGSNKEKRNLMVFIHPVIMRNTDTADKFTNEKYQDIRRAQHDSKILQRGILKEKAKQFPENPRDVLTGHSERPANTTKQHVNTNTQHMSPHERARAERIKRKNYLEQQQRERNAERRRQHQLQQQQIQQRRNQLLQQKRNEQLRLQKLRNNVSGTEVQPKTVVANTNMAEEKVVVKTNNQQGSVVIENEVLFTPKTESPKKIVVASKEINVNKAQNVSKRVQTKPASNIESFYQQSFQ